MIETRTREMIPPTLHFAHSLTRLYPILMAQHIPYCVRGSCHAANQLLPSGRSGPVGDDSCGPVHLHRTIAMQLSIRLEKNVSKTIYRHKRYVRYQLRMRWKRVDNAVDNDLPASTTRRWADRAGWAHVGKRSGRTSKHICTIAYSYLRLEQHLQNAFKNGNLFLMFSLIDIESSKKEQLNKDVMLTSFSCSSNRLAISGRTSIAMRSVPGACE